MTIVEHYLLPATLFLLMFSMGLSLTLANFIEVFRYRTAVVVGVASLALPVPAIGLALAHSFQLAPLLAVGRRADGGVPGRHVLQPAHALRAWRPGPRDQPHRADEPGRGHHDTVVHHFALTEFLAQDTVISMPVGKTILRIFGLTIVPVSLGVLVHARGPARISALADPLKNLAALLIGAFFLLLILGQRARRSSTPYARCGHRSCASIRRR
jgi:BASS family bile acid:Na+ symporter